MDASSVRAARARRRRARLLYESARPYYDAYAGWSRARGRCSTRLWARRGHTASWEFCTVARPTSALVGVLAGFPAADGDRSRAASSRSRPAAIPPWRWPGDLAPPARARRGVAPQPPARAATSTRSPSTPVAPARASPRALLDEPSAAAAPPACGVALDTGLDNAAARALYERVPGFRERASPPRWRRPHGPRVGGPGFVAYFAGSRRRRAACAAPRRPARPGRGASPGRTGGRRSGPRRPRPTGNSPPRWPKASW